jgi:hypothetical protein
LTGEKTLSPDFLHGELAEFPLADVLQLLLMTRKSGELRLENEPAGNSAAIFFDRGNIMHASSNGIEGRPAVETLLKWTGGRFGFIPGTRPPKITINAPAQAVLMDAITRYDELLQIERELPPYDIPLYINPAIGTAPSLTPMEWRVLALVNGHRNIMRMCEEIGDEFETKSALLSLIQKGAVTVKLPDESWHTLIPRVIPTSDVKSERPFPPRIRTNLVLKSIDGKTRLADIWRTANTTELEFLEDIRFLHETRWIDFGEVVNLKFLQD